jgi:hypothetical protein
MCDLLGQFSFACSARGIQVRSAVLGDAADLLFDNWPRTDGPKYAEARRACLHCDGSNDSLAWTRHAAKEAAREAGILVEE